MGRCHLDFDLACCDDYGNHIPFSHMPKVDMSLNLKRHVNCRINAEMMGLSHDKLTVHFEDLTIESNQLDQIRPDYEANMVLSSSDATFSVTIPCQVTPGPFRNVEMIPTNFGENLYPGNVCQQLEFEFLDAYGNHALGGSVEVILDGFSFQDDAGSKREIDEHGCLNLSGALKVSAGHGQTVSISLISESKDLKKVEFQTKQRFLKLASELPKHCYIGTQLHAVIFEVHNDEGSVDTSIHNEGLQLQSHMLLINIDGQLLQYAFKNGYCTVPRISLPQKEGVFRLTATHSSYPDIRLRLKVKVIQAPTREAGNLNSQDGTFPLLVQVRMDVCAEEKELYGAVLDHGKDIGVIEEELKSLQIQKTEIEQDMLALEGLQSRKCFNSSLDTKLLMDIIDSQSESAASIVCNLLTSESLEEPVKSFMTDVVGIVSQIGAVKSEQLSRVLAEYLGEDQMLAIVCRTGDGASALQKCQEVKDVAAALGKLTLHRFDVICLEDIKPFSGGYVPCDYQMNLLLRNPTLENGNSPAGFLGHAVNMVHLESAHLSLKTSAGLGLRETLFYRLFGELQVYDTLDHMKQSFARGCLIQSAVSLDGGIARGNGVFSCGFGNLKVRFPLFTLEYSQDERETQLKLEEKKMELVHKHNQIMWLTEVHQKADKKFQRKYKKYQKFMDRNERLLKSNTEIVANGTQEGD